MKKKLILFFIFLTIIALTGYLLTIHKNNFPSVAKKIIDNKTSHHFDFNNASLKIIAISKMNPLLFAVLDENKEELSAGRTDVIVLIKKSENDNFKNMDCIVNIPDSLWQEIEKAFNFDRSSNAYFLEYSYGLLKYKTPVTGFLKRNIQFALRRQNKKNQGNNTVYVDYFNQKLTRLPNGVYYIGDFFGLTCAYYNLYHDLETRLTGHNYQLNVYLIGDFTDIDLMNIEKERNYRINIHRIDFITENRNDAKINAIFIKENEKIDSFLLNDEMQIRHWVSYYNTELPLFLVRLQNERILK